MSIFILESAKIAPQKVFQIEGKWPFTITTHHENVNEWFVGEKSSWKHAHILRVWEFLVCGNFRQTATNVLLLDKCWQVSETCGKAFYIFNLWRSWIIIHDTNLAGECIKCFVGNVTEAKPENLVDCDNLGIQREELYCRNITIYQNGGENSPIESVQRSCVAMSWYWMSSPNHYWTSHSRLTR